MGAARLRTVPLRTVRAVAAAVCAIGIGGMIVGSIADSNPAALTFGLSAAVSALCLIAVSAVAPSSRTTIPEDTAAELEDLIQSLVRDGAHEGAVRRLVHIALNARR